MKTPLSVGPAEDGDVTIVDISGKVVLRCDDIQTADCVVACVNGRYGPWSGADTVECMRDIVHFSNEFATLLRNAKAAAVRQVNKDYWQRLLNNHNRIVNQAERALAAAGVKKE